MKHAEMTRLMVEAINERRKYSAVRFDGSRTYRRGPRGGWIAC